MVFNTFVFSFFQEVFRFLSDCGVHMTDVQFSSSELDYSDRDFLRTGEYFLDGLGRIDVLADIL